MDQIHMWRKRIQVICTIGYSNILYILYLYLWIKFICGGKEFRSSVPLAIQIFYIFYIYIYGSNSYVEEKNSGHLHHWLFKYFIYFIFIFMDQIHMWRKRIQVICTIGYSNILYILYLYL